MSLTHLKLGLDFTKLVKYIIELIRNVAHEECGWVA